MKCLKVPMPAGRCRSTGARASAWQVCAGHCQTVDRAHFNGSFPSAGWGVAILKGAVGLYEGHRMEICQGRVPATSSLTHSDPRLQFRASWWSTAVSSMGDRRPLPLYARIFRLLFRRMFGACCTSRMPITSARRDAGPRRPAALDNDAVVKGDGRTISSCVGSAKSRIVTSPLVISVDRTCPRQVRSTADRSRIGAPQQTAMDRVVTA